MSAILLENSNTFFYINDELYNYRMGTGMTNHYDEDYYNSFKKGYVFINNSSLIQENKDYSSLFIKRYFDIVGRSITQTRFSSKISYKERKKYLENIRTDFIFINNINYFNSIKKKLKFSYKLLDYLLIHKHYLTIHIFLILKNMFAK